ncbi:MAG: hypothetical protein AAGE61_17555 [Pseudomonadota bacterium]
MVFLFRIIARLFVLFIAYVFAVIAGIATLFAIVANWQSETFSDQSLTPGEEAAVYVYSSYFGALSFFHISAAALVPALVAIVFTEAFSIRSLTWQIVLGGCVAVAILTMSGVHGEAIPPQNDVVISLAAGFVAGLTYWLIAGRSAGSWRTTAGQGRYSTPNTPK